MWRGFKIPKRITMKQDDRKNARKNEKLDDAPQPPRKPTEKAVATSSTAGRLKSTVRKVEHPPKSEGKERGKASPNPRSSYHSRRKSHPPRSEGLDGEAGGSAQIHSALPPRQKTSKDTPLGKPGTDTPEKLNPQATDGFGSLHRMVKPSMQGYKTKMWTATGKPPRATEAEKKLDLAALRREAMAEQEKLTKIGPEKELVIYTDGSCWRNGAIDARAAIGVFFGRGSSLNISETARIRHRQTNNSAELLAAEAAVRTALKKTTYKRLCLVTDSNLLVKGWKSIPYWQKNGWKTAAGQPIKNRREFKLIQRLVADTPGCTLRIVLVKGHADNEGNIAADALAAAAIQRHKELVNQQAWDANPGCPPIEYHRSRYGEDPIRSERVSEAPSAARRHQRRINEIDLERSVTLKRMQDNPELARKAAQLSRDARKRPAKRDLREKIQAKAGSDDLRNRIIIKRNANRSPEPPQKIQVSVAVASGSKAVTIRDEDRRQREQVKPAPKMPRAADGKKTQQQREHERELMELALFEMEDSGRDLRKHLLVDRIQQEAIRAQKRQLRNRRRNRRREAKRYFKRLNYDIDAPVEPIPDTPPPIEWPEGFVPPGQEAPEDKTSRASTPEPLDMDSEDDVRSSSPSSIDLIMDVN